MQLTYLAIAVLACSSEYPERALALHAECWELSGGDYSIEGEPGVRPLLLSTSSTGHALPVLSGLA